MVAEAPANPILSAHSEEVRDEALRRYCTGESLDAVAEGLNIPAGTIRSWSARYGWSREKFNNAIRTCVKLAPATGKNTLRTLGNNCREEVADVLRNHVAVLRNNPATTVAELRNTPEGQGLAAVTKTVVDALATVHGWGDEKTVGIVFGGDLRAFDTPREQVLEAEIVDQSVNTEEQIQGVVEPLNIIPPS